MEEDAVIESGEGELFEIGLVLRSLAVKLDLDRSEVGLNVENRLFRELLHHCLGLGHFLGLLQRVFKCGLSSL